MAARIHHYVPQLYLRGFCADAKRRKLFVVDGVEKTTFVTRPRNVAAERDFNRIELEGFEPDTLERDFSEFETDVSAAIERICERGTFRDEEDRALVLNLVGLMALRNPRQRERMNDFQSRVAKTIMQMSLETPERWARQVEQATAAGYMKADADTDYATMKEFFERGEYTVEMVREAHIALELSTFDKVLPFLFERKWTLFRANADAGGFVTSDHPVCLMWNDPARRDGIYPPGFGLTGTGVLFPLSSEFALLGMFEGEEGERDADILLVADCNTTIIAFAQRQVYAADPDFPYLRRSAMPFGRGEECLGDGTFVRPRPKEE